MKNKKVNTRFLPKGKRAQEMTIGTIVVIIIVLVVLVVVIYGFTTGWSNLFEKMGVFGGGKSNVQTIVQGCQLACTTSSNYDWCSKQRNIVVDDETNEGKTKSLSEKTCNAIAGKYGLEECTGITCKVVEEGTCSGDTINPDCSSQNDKGEKLCKAVTGCKWIDDASTDVNIGKCEIDTLVKCASYNDDKANCDILKCTWLAV